MAYGEKYYHEYCNRYGTVCRVSILERDFEGTPLDKDCGAIPFALNYESVSDDKFDRIKSSTAEVRFIGNDSFDMEELYTADMYQYKIQHTIGGQIKWVGWVVPNGFTEDWVGGLREMVIQAIDGLSLLDQYRFLDSSGNPFNYDMRHITILFTCLNFIGLELPIHTMVSLGYDGQTTDIDPVYAAMTNPNTYMDTSVEDEDTFNHTYIEYKNNAFSCYDVLMDICRVWGAKVYQNNGAWKFKRVAEDYGDLGSREWRVYDNASGQSGTEIYDPQITFPCISTAEHMVLDGAVKYMDNVFKWQNYQYVYRYKQNGDSLTPLIANGYFLPTVVPTDPSTFTPDGWERVGVTTFNVSKEPALGGDNPPNHTGATLKLSGIAGVSTDSGLRSANITNQVYIKKGDKIYLSWWQKTPYYEIGGGNRVYAKTVIKVTLRSFKNDNNSQYTDYNLVNTGFDKENNYLNARWQEYVPSSTRSYSFVGFGRTNPADLNGWTKVSIDIPVVPANGYLSIVLRSAAIREEEIGRPGMDDTGVSFYAFDSVVDFPSGSLNWQEVEMFAISNEWKVSDMYTGRVVNESGKNVPKGVVYTHEQDKVFNKRSQAVNILTSDVVNNDAIGGIHFNFGTFDGPINDWNDIYNPYNQSAPLGMIASRDVMRQYRNIWRVIEGGLIAEELDIDSTIVFEDRPNERYIVQRGTFSGKDCNLSGATLLQISDSNDTSMSGNETIQDNYGDIDLERRFIN